MSLKIINPDAKSLLFSLEKMNLIKISIKKEKSNESKLLEDIKTAVKEISLHKQKKIKLKTAQELLNEL